MLAPRTNTLSQQMDYGLLTLALAALAAGFVDSIVGGGGLILVPALFSAFPTTPPATLFGTNKGGAIWGTSASMLSFLRRVRIPWSTVLPATLAAFVGAFLGALTISHVESGDFRKALPLILTAVLVYTLWRKDLGHQHKPHLSGRAETALAIAGGGLIGFYDGFFGPGTGNFLVFLFVRGFGFDFLHATASAKVVNVACNLAALLLFSARGHVMWPYAALIAVCNITGSVLGTRLAMRRGTHFVRWMFLGIVALLIAKTAWDAFFGAAAH
jgi:Predicted permeases